MTAFLILAILISIVFTIETFHLITFSVFDFYMAKLSFEKSILNVKNTKKTKPNVNILNTFESKRNIVITYQLV